MCAFEVDESVLNWYFSSQNYITHYYYKVSYQMLFFLYALISLYYSAYPIATPTFKPISFILKFIGNNLVFFRPVAYRNMLYSQWDKGELGILWKPSGVMHQVKVPLSHCSSRLIILYYVPWCVFFVRYDIPNYKGCLNCLD